MGGLPAKEWDALTDGGNPFVSHAFLAAMEHSGSVGDGSGWTPVPITVTGPDGRLAAALPAYLKQHSQGEYVFDHSWADAYERAGGRYYPKLLGAVPFTPATGPRLIADSPAVQAALLAAMADRGAALPSQAGDDRTVRIIGPTTRVPSAVTSDLVASGFRTMRFTGSSSSLVSAQLADYFRNSYTGTRVVLARTGGGRTSDPAIAAGQRAPVLVVTTSAPGSVTSLVQRSPHWPAVRALGSTTRVSSASLTKVRRA